jgi:hypothetical protein
VPGKDDTAPRKAGRKKKGPPKHRPTQDERDACALMAAEAQLKKRTWKELDETMGAPVGFTGKLLRGELRYTDERGRKVRAAMDYDEERFLRELAHRKALRRAARRSWGFGRSPDRKRAHHHGAVQPRDPKDEDDSEEDAPVWTNFPSELVPALTFARDLVEVPEPRDEPAADGKKRKKKPSAPG